MDFLKNLAKRLTPQPRNDARYYNFSVKCKRCGEIISGRADLHNEVSIEYEQGGDVYYVRKVLMGTGENHCYQKIEVGLKFNANHILIDKTITGGAFDEK